MAKQTRILLLALGAAVLAGGGLAVWALKERAGRLDAVNLLQQGHYRSYYGLTDSLDDIITSLGKLQVVDSPELTMALLLDISRKADAAVTFTGEMPVSPEDTGDIIGFFNLTGDYCRALFRKASRGDILEYEDAQCLVTLHNSCVLLSEDFFAMQTNSSWYLSQSTRGSLARWLGEDMQSLMQRRIDEGIEFPTLIYDGPFSESLVNRKPRALGGEEVDESVARMVAEEDLALSGVSIGQKTGGYIPAYPISATSPAGYPCFAQVSAAGGKLTMYLEDCDVRPVILTPEECVQSAREFVTRMGLGEVVATWTQQYDGLFVVNFAPVTEDIILYPDLIKVRVRMDDGGICGFDARGYYMNHEARDLSEDFLSREEAQNLVTMDLAITKSQLCIIPTTGGGEMLCWEFTGAFAQETYIIYLDAVSGREEEIFKVVETDTGLLTV